MIMYHATSAELPLGKSLKTPTGASCMDCTAGGVVYLTSTITDCARYGTVYEIDVKNPVSYAELRKMQGLKKKKGRYTRNVFVALPEDTKILKKLA